MSLKPLSDKSLREVIHNFTPNWFTLNMGTGIAFLTLHNVDINLFAGQATLIKTLWLVDMVFFVLFVAMFVARIFMFPGTIKLLLQHPVQSMFLGAIPMALVPILEGWILFGPEIIGEGALTLALWLWWLDVILAVAVGWLLPYFMFTVQKHDKLENMTAIWLLPIVASEVAAAAGGMLAPFYSGITAETIIMTSYVLWAFSMPLSFSVLVILLLRLVLHKLPHRAMAVTSWLTLGPLATGSLGLLTLGSASTIVYADTPLAGMADFANSLGLIVGLILWGYALWWYVMAWIITLKYFKEGLPFNMGWWGFTFPVGVFTAATLQLWHETGYLIFAILSAVFTTQLIVFWVLVFVKTLRGMWDGHLFIAPCLSEETGLLKEEEACDKIKSKD